MLNWFWNMFYDRCTLCSGFTFRPKDKIVYLGLDKDDKTKLFERKICRSCADIIESVKDQKVVNVGGR